MLQIRPLVLAALLAVVSAAAGAQLQFAVQTGAGSAVRPGAFTPVEVVLTNGDTPYEGAVYAQFQGGSAEGFRARRTVELPAQSTKRVFLYPMPRDYETSITVWYEDEDGTSVQEFSEPVNVLEATTPVLGIVGDQFGGLPPERSDDGRKRYYYRTFMRPDQVPPRPEGLEMFDALVFSPALEQPLSAPQAEAIQQWAAMGGVAVFDLSRRTDALQQPIYRDMLPFHPQGVAPVQPPGFAREVPVAAATLRPGARVVLGTAEQPLIAERDHGAGSIAGFAFPIESPAFREYAVRNETWRRILPPVIGPPDLLDQPESAAQQALQQPAAGQGDAESLAAAVTEAPSTGLRLSVVFVLTALYALAAGPGDYLLVRKVFRKPRLTWITFPIIVALFTGLSYVGARFWIGGDLEARHNRVTFYYHETGVAYHRDTYGLFVPRGADYRIETGESGLLRHLGMYMGNQDPITQDLDTGALRQRIPIWTNRAYLALSPAVDAPDVTVDARQTAEEITLEIANNTGTALHPRAVILGEQAWMGFGANAVLDAGASNEWTIERSAPGGHINLSGNVFMPRESRRRETHPLRRPHNLNAVLERGNVAVVFDHVTSPPTFSINGVETPLDPSQTKLVVVVPAQPHREAALTRGTQRNP